MGVLYLFQFTLEYRGLSQPELFRTWLKEAEVAMKHASPEGSVVKQIWKIVGERKVNAVMDVASPDHADTITMELPIMKDFGDQVHIEVTPIISYESLAKDLGINLKIEPQVTTGADEESAEGMYYWLQFKLHQEGMSHKDILVLLTQKAVSAMPEMKIVHVWKAVAKNEIHAVLRVSTPEEIDRWLNSEQALLAHMGDKMSIECKSLRSYRGFAEDLKKRVSASDDPTS